MNEEQINEEWERGWRETRTNDNNNKCSSSRSGRMVRIKNVIFCLIRCAQWNKSVGSNCILHSNYLINFKFHKYTKGITISMSIDIIQYLYIKWYCWQKYKIVICHKTITTWFHFSLATCLHFCCQRCPYLHHHH